MITSDTKVLFNVYDTGAIRCKASNSGTKWMKKKIRKSPFVQFKDNEPVSFSKDMKKWTKVDKTRPIPGYYEGPKRYNHPDYYPVVKQTVLSSECVQYFTSDEGRPYTITPFIWKKMNKEQKLKANLEYSADGKEFSFEYLN